MRKIICLILVAVMCSSLCLPVLAATDSNENEELPAWVREGEIWVPATAMMLREDFGDCPQGHVAPEGYKFEGYTIGQVTGSYDILAGIVTILSAFTENKFLIRVATVGATFLNWLDGREDPNFHYLRYVYTAEGKAPYIHTIYAYYGNGVYTYEYLTCEDYYEI